MSTMTREEWLAERKKGIGGSDAAAILGISPWATPVTVWLDKTGRSTPTEPNHAMRIGTELEDLVARLYCENSGRSVQRFNTMLHKGHLLGNIDRLVIPEGAKVASHMGEVRTDTLLECKTSSRDWDDGVPLYYETQVQVYMSLAPQVQHADVACLFLNRKNFEIYRVERDDEVITMMSERLNAWWEEYVIGDKMPPPMNEADCRLLWARSNPGKSITATKEIEDKLETYKRFKANEKSAKEAASELQSDICAYLGDAEVLTGVDGKPMLTWKSSKDSNKTDWEALARSLGATDELIAQYTSVSIGSRRFLVKTAKAK